MSAARLAILCVCLCFHVVSVLSQFGFFPQRETRRQNGFGENFFPNSRRITQNLAGILHFRPGNNNGNQQFIYPFNNIPGISNNRPIYDQVRFPDRGRDIPNDPVNFGPSNPDENNGLISGINNGPVFGNDNGGLISGSNNGQPVFGNDNGGLISGSNNGQPVFDNNNGGLISGSNNGQPVFGNNNGGLISGSNNGPVFSNDNSGLISGNNNGRPVFDNNDNGGSSEIKDERPTFVEIEDDGAVSSYDDGKQEPPTPVVVVDDVSGLNFGDRNAEEETTSSPPLPPVPETETEDNLNFNGQGAFSETCTTVDGNAGACISLRSCQPYLKLLQQSQTNPEAVTILRRAHCGFEGNYPKVCCPRQAAPTQAPQPQPQPTASTKTAGGFLEGFPEPPVCGVSSASFSRVVGGINATLGDFPWMALLGYRSKRDGSTRWLCGGSLVSARHVLTAAHCIHNHEEDLYVVRLGELDLARDDEGATPIDVVIKTKVKHESYDAKSFTNDIGLLLLERDVQFTDLIRPICIPTAPELRARSFVDYNPMIAGWGDTEFRGPSATLLQVLQLPVVSNEDCAKAYASYTAQVIDQRVLCAGFKRGGKDACQGDSGGPLMQPIWNSQTLKTFFYQIGVVSYGKRCAEAGFPGVYTRVTEFVPWIQKNMLGSA